MILGRIAGNQATEVYTFNAPGFDMLPNIGTSNKTELFFQELIKTYSDAGLSCNIEQLFNTAKMHNYVFLGDEGVANIISKIGQFSNTLPFQAA